MSEQTDPWDKALAAFDGGPIAVWSSFDHVFQPESAASPERCALCNGDEMSTMHMDSPR